MTVVWDGTQDRHGTCQSLTGYTGGSSLNNIVPEAGLSAADVKALYELLRRPVAKLKLRRAGHMGRAEQIRADVFRATQRGRQK